MSNDRFLTRVWDKQEKKMIYSKDFDSISKHVYKGGYVSLNAEGIIFAVPEFGSKTFEDGFYLDFVEYGDRFIPMQCLGKYDKNKKLIYQHDIIKTLNYKYICYWDEESGALWFNRLDNECQIMFFDFSCEIEIIGNKFEQPKLMEVKA